MPTGMLFWPTTEEGKAPLGLSPSSTLEPGVIHLGLCSLGQLPLWFYNQTATNQGPRSGMS